MRRRLPLQESLAQGLCELPTKRRRHEIADHEAPAVRSEDKTVRLIRSLFQNNAQPKRLKAPQTAFSVHADPLDGEGSGGEAQGFPLPRAFVIVAKREIKKRHIETEEPADWPCSDRDEADADAEADDPEAEHQEAKGARRQAAMRQKDALEKDAAAVPFLFFACRHGDGRIAGKAASRKAAEAPS